MKPRVKLLTILCGFALLLTACGGKAKPASEKVSEDTTSEEAPSEETPSEGASEEVTYTITWNNYDGTELEKDLNVKKGTIPTYDGATPVRENDGTYTYTWTGWDPAVAAATKDQTYTATFSKEKVSYTIKFDLNGGTSATYNGQSKTVYGLSADDFFFDCVKAGWNFRGWSFKNEKVFDENGHQLANPPMEKEMTFVAIYAQTARLTIVKNIEEAGEVTGSGEYEYNTDVDITATANEGYIFLGWYVEDILVSAQENYKYRMWSSDVIIEARFSMSVNKLHIESNNPTRGLVRINNNEGGANGAEDNGYFPRGTQIQVVAFSLDETRYLGWFDDDNQLVSTGALYTFTMPDEEYNLEAKWNYFEIEYDLDGGINHDDNEDHYTVEEVPTLYNPHRDGYRFDGWKLDDENETIVTAINPNWMRHIKLTATWSMDTYTITYVLDGGTNNPDNPASYTTFDFDDGPIELHDASKRGYRFIGWYLHYEEGVYSEPIEEITSDYAQNLTLYARFDIIDYSITYNLDGGTNNSNNPHAYTVEDEITLLGATKTGYNFDYWYDANEKVWTKINKGTIGNLTLYAHYSPKQYSLTVSVNDKTLGTAEVVTGSGYYNENITVKATTLKENPFKGWYKGGSLVSSNLTYTFKMPNESVSLVATFMTDTEYSDIKLGKTPVLKDSTTITYGFFAKDKVTDSTLISNLNSKATLVNNFYKYNNEYYLRRTVDGVKNWFKCEALEWTIAKKNGNTYTLIAKNVIVDYAFSSTGEERYIDGETISPNNYYHSALRTYLNGQLFDTIFGFHSSYVKTTSLSINGKNVQDKMYLPALEDSFEGGIFYQTTLLKCNITDFANFNNIGNFYWTRTPGSTIGTYAFDRTNSDFASKNATLTLGVRPMITFQYTF